MSHPLRGGPVLCTKNGVITTVNRGGEDRCEGVDVSVAYDSDTDRIEISWTREARDEREYLMVEMTDIRTALGAGA